MEKESKIELYDVIRIIATLFVVIGHSCYTMWSGDSGFIELNLDKASRVYYTLSMPLNRIVGWVYSFHMPLFFMLSGALFAYSRKQEKFDDLVNNKVSRLIIPYFLAGILYMFPIKRLSGFYTKDNFVPALEGFLLGANSGHLWFLISLFWCFIIFYPLNKILKSRTPWLEVILSFCIYFLNSAGIFNLQIFVSIPCFSNAIMYFPYFLLGNAVEAFRRKYSCDRIVVVLLTLILLLFSYLQFITGTVQNHFIAAIMGSATIYMIAYWISKFKWLVCSRIFKVFLRNSMFIYLFHEPINFLVLQWASHTNAISSFHGTILYFAGRTIFPILISVFLGTLMIKAKGTKYKVFKIRVRSDN